jgi:hypothetical protein
MPMAAGHRRLRYRGLGPPRASSTHGAGSSPTLDSMSSMARPSRPTRAEDVALTITAFGCARRAPLEPKASRMNCRLLRPPDNLRHHADKDMRGSALPKQK